MEPYTIQKSDVDKMVSLYYNIQTRRAYSYALESVVGLPCTLEALQAEVHGWSDYAQSTIVVRRSALKKLIEFLQGRNLCEKDILSWLQFPTGRPRNERQPIPDAQIHKLFECASRPREKLLMVILFDTGLRIGTVADIKLKHLADDSFRIQAKRGKWLTVYVTPGIRRVASNITGSPEEYVFDTLGEHDARAKRVSRIFQDVCKVAGVKATPHQIRHSFATRLARKGIPVPVISGLMGHSSIKTTQGYIHLDDLAQAAVRDAAIGGKYL